MTIRDELLSLQDKNEIIHPKLVLNWARTHRKSEVGLKLEWDDKKAADEHRLSQIRQLIEVHVVYPATGQRQTVSLVMDRGKGGGYRPLQPVLNNSAMRAMLIRQILDEMARVIDRYPQLSEITLLRDAIEAQRRGLEDNMPLAAD